MPMVPLQRNISFCFLGGKQALLVLPASTRGGSSPAGTDGPGRESWRGGSSRQTARGKTKSAAWRSARLPIHASKAWAKHRAGAALASRPSPHWLHTHPPPTAMPRRGTRSGPCMVLGGRLLQVAGRWAALSPRLQRWIRPRSFNQKEIVPESVGR